MGLKIEHIGEDSLRGTLDGTLPVIGQKDADLVRISIAGWVHEVACDMVRGTAAMRHAVYDALARYREAHRRPHYLTLAE